MAGLGRAREESADVAIVGSSLAGLVAGAILARRGRRVVVLEHADTVGGRGGSIRTPEGYWVDFGPRDGHDVGDCQLPWHHGAEAAREAGIALELRPIAHPLRVHRFPEGTVFDGDWSAEGFAAVARDVFECPEEALGELLALLARFASAEPREIDAAIPQALGGWLAENVAHPAVARAVLLMATVVFHRHPEEASAGRLMQFFKAPRSAGPFIADDDEVGGMQGLIEPWARAIRARGGEIALGWKPVEIVVEGGRVRGAVAVDRANLVREVRAPVVVCTYPLWEVFDLVDEGLFGADLVATAKALRSHRADLVGWVAGLERLPRIRATGRSEHHEGWNRLLHGPDRAYRGGYQISSMSSRRAAPAGKHFLQMAMVRWFRGGSTAGQAWTGARAEIDEMIAYLRRFYADIDECVEWSAYQYVSAPQSMSWFWAPVRRHALEVPGIRGLLLAGSTIETTAPMVDIGAWAGLQAARAAERLEP